MTFYRAPWSRILIVISSLLSIFCGGILVWSLIAGGPLVWLGVMILGMMLGCSLFMVLGYSVGPDALVVHRPLWRNRLALTGLKSAQPDPSAMRWSLRTFGNGGFYSFTGRYWNRTLGHYRALVNDPARAVVLKWTDRTIVVSPDPPLEFARQLQQLAQNPPGPRTSGAGPAVEQSVIDAS